jgi:hypothetical protein
MNQPSRHQRKLQKNLAYRGACVYDPRRKFPRLTLEARKELTKEMLEEIDAWLHKYMAIPPRLNQTVTLTSRTEMKI